MELYLLGGALDLWQGISDAMADTYRLTCNEHVQGPSQEVQTVIDNDTGSSMSGQSAAISMRSTMPRPAPSLMTGKSRGSMAVRISTAGSSTENNVGLYKRTASMASSIAGGFVKQQYPYSG